MKMSLKRTGEKLDINHRGIHRIFSVDKYDYLRYLYPVLKMLRDLKSKHANIELKDLNKLSDKELLEGLIDDNPRRVAFVEQRLESYKKAIELEFEDIENRADLSEIEKRVFRNNLELMQDYMIQRKFNKAIYHAAIDEARKLILKKEVSKLVTSSNPSFMHILVSIKNDIKAVRTSSSVDVYMFSKDEQNFLMLRNPTYLG